MSSEGIIQGSADVIHTDTRSPFVKFDLVVQAQQTPGVVLFNNYEQLKASIGNGVSYYSQFEYSLENYQIALKHHNELKHVKSVLEKTKREIVKNYNAPLEIVEKRIDELIDLIKIPYKKVDTFIKQNEKNSKKYDSPEKYMLEMYASSYYISNTLNNIKREYSLFGTTSPTFFKIQGEDTDYIAKCIKGKSLYTNVKYYIAWPGQNTAQIRLAKVPGVEIDELQQFKTMNNCTVWSLVATFTDKNPQLDALLQTWGYNLDTSEELTLLWPPSYENDESYDKQEKEVKQDLLESVNKIFEKMYHGSRQITIDDNYRIQLITSVGDEKITTDESKGLEAVKNFSFITGLVDLARKRARKVEKSPFSNEPDIFTTEPYPIVMDAPFSNVDEIHINNISSILPEIAEQVKFRLMIKN